MPGTRRPPSTGWERNGVRAPLPGTLCGQAWSLFDSRYEAVGKSRKAILAEGVKLGLNEGNLSTELVTWRRFHGIVSPTQEPNPVSVKGRRKDWVPYPHNPGLCADAWTHFADCYDDSVTVTAAIIKSGVAKGLNAGNLCTELSYWRKANGIAAPTAHPAI